jgi:hypothetical protein
MRRPLVPQAFLASSSPRLSHQKSRTDRPGCGGLWTGGSRGDSGGPAGHRVVGQEVPVGSARDREPVVADGNVIARRRTEFAGNLDEDRPARRLAGSLGAIRVHGTEVVQAAVPENPRLGP